MLYGITSKANTNPLLISKNIVGILIEIDGIISRQKGLEDRFYQAKITNMADYAFRITSRPIQMSFKRDLKQHGKTFVLCYYHAEFEIENKKLHNI